MKIALPKQLNRESWLRYLQVEGEPEARLVRQMVEAENMLLETATPRGIYRVIDRQDLATDGVSIEKHLEGCHRVAVMAVTLGSDIDALIRQYEVKNMLMAMVTDTGASVLAEQAADDAERVMKEEIKRRSPDLYCTPRFSPGYGDYPLSHQKEILAYIDAWRKIGVTLTPGNMMVPSKSITAIVGLADYPVMGRLATCGECVLREKCTLWREGKHC